MRISLGISPGKTIKQGRPSSFRVSWSLGDLLYVVISFYLNIRDFGGQAIGVGAHVWMDVGYILR
jgi:hypothetical protein